MIIAVKGSIGSGKSYVSKYISNKFNYNLINGDKIVAELYTYDYDLIKRVNDEFNLTGDVVNKKELGKIVFSDKDALKRLEKIVHPVLSEVINLKLEGCENSILDVQVIDKLNVEYDYVIIVEASREVAIRRVQERDNRDVEMINEILDLQKTHYILDKRTYVVKNNDDSNVEEQVSKIVKGFNDCENW